MIATALPSALNRAALITGAILFLCRQDGSAAVWRRFQASMALRRCTRLLARSDAAREAGNRAGAEAYMVRAIAALKRSDRIAGSAR